MNRLQVVADFTSSRKLTDTARSALADHVVVHRSACPEALDFDGLVFAIRKLLEDYPADSPLAISP